MGRVPVAVMDERRATIAAIVYAGAPMSVRHAFYQAVGAGIGIPKNLSGYEKVQRVVLELRRDGEIRYNEFVDGTRSRQTVSQFDGIEDALVDIHATYRRNLWSDSDYDIEVWCESDSILGTGRSGYTAACRWRRLSPLLATCRRAPPAASGLPRSRSAARRRRGSPGSSKTPRSERHARSRGA